MIQLIAEIGINHNGSLDIAKKLIDAACIAGFNYVKFQKRNPDKCVPDYQKNIIKKTPWGEMTYLEYKHRLEFDYFEYRQIDEYCKKKNIKWFVSVWDLDSIDFMTKFPHIKIGKIPSALITDLELCEKARNQFNILMVSTGMSNEEQIENCIKINPDIIFHTHSAYPAPYNELNLEYIKWLKNKYPEKEIGYSGHEYGITTTFAAAAMGARWIERHITLDHEMWGSDQSSSIDLVGMIKLVKGIRTIEQAMGGYEERTIKQSEYEKLNSLRSK